MTRHQIYRFFSALLAIAAIAVIAAAFTIAWHVHASNQTRVWMITIGLAAGLVAVIGWLGNKS